MAVHTSPIPAGAVSDLEAGFRGSVFRPGEVAYDEARSVWNGMIDRRPAVIVQPAGAADVILAVDFARKHDLLIAVKGAGHNIAGNAVCDDGLMIDLARMNSVHVDPVARTARVGPGATLHDFDHEAQAFGLATPLGINATTGVAGLTLGGGFGWLSRKHGMTVDNLLAVDLVTADGELVHVSEDHHPDLFWAVRGGGGNFGIVTAFEFQLHDVGPEVLAGMLVYPHAEGRAVLEHLRTFNADAPDELSVYALFRQAPPLPFLPDDIHGTDVLFLIPCYVGDLEEGERVLAPLREFGDPIADVIQPQPYVAWQQTFDPLLGPGLRNYWKSHNFTSLSDGVIDAVIDYAASIPSPHSEIFLIQMGGAMRRVPVDATAYPHRDVAYAMNVHTRWEDSARDEECIAWARDLFDAVAPYAMGSAYVNFISEDAGEERRGYGINYERLVDAKDEWDPENRFRMNQNIPPSS